MTNKTMPFKINVQDWIATPNTEVAQQRKSDIAQRARTGYRTRPELPLTGPHSCRQPAKEIVVKQRVGPSALDKFASTSPRSHDRPSNCRFALVLISAHVHSIHRLGLERWPPCMGQTPTNQPTASKNHCDQKEPSPELNACFFIEKLG